MAAIEWLGAGSAASGEGCRCLDSSLRTALFCAADKSSAVRKAGDALMAQLLQVKRGPSLTAPAAATRAKHRHPCCELLHLRARKRDGGPRSASLHDVLPDLPLVSQRQRMTVQLGRLRSLRMGAILCITRAGLHPKQLVTVFFSRLVLADATGLWGGRAV